MKADSPWDSFSAGRLDVGWRHPFPRTHIAEVLTRHRVRVHSLHVGMGTAIGRELGLVIAVYVSGGSRAEHFGTPDVPNWIRLSVFGIPAADDDHDYTADFDRAVEWISRVPGRGRAWRATDHSFLVTRRNETVEVAET